MSCFCSMDEHVLSVAGPALTLAPARLFGITDARGWKLFHASMSTVLASPAAFVGGLVPNRMQAPCRVVLAIHHAGYFQLPC